MQKIDFGIKKALNVAASVTCHVLSAKVSCRIMPDDCVAFIAAPYGFGPSSKAIAISSHLPRSINRVFFGDGPPLDMARRSNEFSSCLRLDFNLQETRAAELLSEYPVLVFVNSMRFLRASSLTCDAIMFVDTLAWLRTSRQLCSTSLSAYFAQRFFDYPFPADLESTDCFRAVGAIVPKTLIPRSGDADEIELYAKSPIVHCGGLFSPAMCNGADAIFAERLFGTLERLDTPLRVIVPEQLRGQFECRPTRHLSLIDCTPITVSEHIAGSSFALTTSGIEFTYESTLLGVPTLFLPPFNVSQLLQLQYHRQAFDGSVHFPLPSEEFRVPLASLDQQTSSLQKAGMLGRWDHQFAAIRSYLEHALSENGNADLKALRHVQTNAVRRVGSDGAQTIASFVVQELSAQGRGRCVSQST